MDDSAGRRSAPAQRSRWHPAELAQEIILGIVVTTIASGLVSLKIYTGVLGEPDSAVASQGPGTTAADVSEVVVKNEIATRTTTSTTVAAQTTTSIATIAPTSAPKEPSGDFSAQVARTCGASGRGDCFLSLRSSPSSTAKEVRRLSDGAAITIVCQVHGEGVKSSILGRSTDIWSATSDGSFMSSAFLVGPKLDPFSITTPQCTCESCGTTNDVAAEGPDTAAMSSHFRGYLRSAGARDYAGAWAMLSPAYQAKYGGFEPFVDFWDRIVTVGITSTTGISEQPARYVLQADLFFDLVSGSRSVETAEVDVVEQSGQYLINDYRVISAEVVKG